MNREFVVAGNWKMHKAPSEARQFARELLQKLPTDSPNRILIFPSVTSLSEVQDVLKHSHLLLGAQNCHFETEGAFTGEVSALALKELGTSYVLVGHSERRQLFNETDSQIAKKIATVQRQGMTPLLCVGETLDQREKKQTENILAEQIQKGLAMLDLQNPLLLAYEPVWAIGTGRVATPEIAEQTQAYIRSLLKIHDEKLTGTSILYGGSVKPDNAGELAKQENIDGFLVGGASLKVADFVALASISKFRGAS